MRFKVRRVSGTAEPVEMDFSSLEELVAWIGTLTEHTYGETRPCREIIMSVHEGGMPEIAIYDDYCE